MLQLRQRIEKFAATNAPVLITGESGTGKERVAHALHALSRRAGKAFVAENCAAIPETLLESVLFGHKKGAFTGAIKDHPGHFLAADGGTIFLDEIGEMRLPMQVKLLRVLQEGEVRAVGDSKVRKVDVRVIAATNQDLDAAVKAGRFREDLFYRLNVLRLELPPLRERGDDVLLLARRFLGEASARLGRPLLLSAAAAEALRRGPWPGNVRQLQNEMQRLAALSDGPQVQLAELSPELRGERRGPP
ncbi:MAG: sigma-54-dependent Fis family transcriptional regulator [Planctomycetes bacterium]|nr:sigma-54-dependent Fis family transcriptional regulator [Planctomycetota bacterium]